MPTAPKPPPGLSRTEFRRWYQTVYCESEYWIWLRQLALDWWEAWRTVAIEGMAARRIADDEASEEARTRAEYDAAGWWNQQVADSRDEE
jgi:hypothetical protein